MGQISHVLSKINGLIILNNPYLPYNNPLDKSVYRSSLDFEEEGAPRPIRLLVIRTSCLKHDDVRKPPISFGSVPLDAPLVGLTYSRQEIYDGVMKKSVEDMVLHFIAERGAITEAGLMKRIKWPPDTEELIKRKHVRGALISLLAQEKIIWTGGLPKQGVFFKDRDQKGFGLPLIRKSGVGGERSSLATKKKEELLLFLMEYHTVQEVADEFGVTYPTAQRALKSLEDKGDVVTMVWHESGRPGRPPILYHAK